MQRSVVDIPYSLARVLNCDWDIDWRGQAAGETTSGNTQVVYNAFPRWVGKPNFILTPSLVAAWRGLRASAQGRVGAYRIRIVDPAGYYDQYLGEIVTFSDGSTFSDGAGFEWLPTYTASSDASAGAESMSVDANSLAAPVVGQIISHDDWLYLVTSVSDAGGGIYDISIQPPLRATVYNGDDVLAQGRGIFEAVDDSTGNPAYGLDRVARFEMQFREVLNR